MRMYVSYVRTSITCECVCVCEREREMHIVNVKVILQPIVIRSVCLGVRPLPGARDQFLIFSLKMSSGSLLVSFK
jgi:hypothetical protein